MTSNYLVCDGREVHVTEWGEGNAECVIAWHGLARTGRDMDELAAYLATRYRVICPDTIGRGLSQWSPQPEREYCLEFYGRLALSLADQLGLERFHWIGTSMGARSASGSLPQHFAIASCGWCLTTSARSSRRRPWSASAHTPATRRSSTA